MNHKPDFKCNPLPLPNGHDKVLLHSCCAPCRGEVMAAMVATGIDFTIFFYNPNIHPRVLGWYRFGREVRVRIFSLRSAF